MFPSRCGIFRNLLLLQMLAAVADSSLLCCAQVGSVSGHPPGDGSLVNYGPVGVLYTFGKWGFEAVRRKFTETPEEAQQRKARQLEALKAASTDPQLELNRKLWRAAERGDARVAKNLIGVGAQVDSRDTATWYKWTALHHAAIDGHTAVVDVLLEGGATVDIPDWDHWTPLHYAAYQGQPRHVQAAERLLQGGADVYEQTWNGRTALDIANTYRHTHMADLLRDFESQHAHQRGFRPRRNNLDHLGIRKDYESFLGKLAAMTQSPVRKTEAHQG